MNAALIKTNPFKISRSYAPNYLYKKAKGLIIGTVYINTISGSGWVRAQIGSKGPSSNSIDFKFDQGTTIEDVYNNHLPEIEATWLRAFQSIFNKYFPE